ncbi:hypothetical protein KBX53_33335 [Micromonospora sp. M51]|uniref:hypothetical protein n=1 Tax=Micromonospora sp. M51 TaxID=2824889 RepID=UPI001B36477B|nr:hypothetical protein [Micromonospora sp. M51]MBQ1015726.1 hypothetical protein [Micromonospora sp. M51]
MTTQRSFKARVRTRMEKTGESARWLPDVEVRIRTATAPRIFRADWAGGPTRIVVGIDAVGESKARVIVLHGKLTGAEQAAELKAYWRERLAALKALLETDGGHR